MAETSESRQTRIGLTYAKNKICHTIFCRVTICSEDCRRLRESFLKYPAEKVVACVMTEETYNMPDIHCANLLNLTYCGITMACPHRSVGFLLRRSRVVTVRSYWLASYEALCSPSKDARLQAVHVHGTVGTTAPTSEMASALTAPLHERTLGGRHVRRPPSIKLSVPTIYSLPNQIQQSFVYTFHSDPFQTDPSE